MRARKTVVIVVLFAASFTLLLIGCSSTGTSSAIAEAGSDGTVSGGDDAASSSDAGLDAPDDGDATFNPCYPVVPAQPFPSDNCVYVGPCAENCLMNTASSYACLVPSGTPGANGDASPSYPSVFTAPIGVINVIAVTGNQYPWDANAYVSCAPLSCVRWSTGDHVGGGSAWPGDPCGDAGEAVEAWSCPESPGVMPPVQGCVNAGALAVLGGAGTGIPSENVWCCPPPPDAGEGDAEALDAAASSDATDGGTTGDSAAD